MNRRKTEQQLGLGRDRELRESKTKIEDSNERETVMQQYQRG